jgi:hypothetical protein
MSHVPVDVGDDLSERDHLEASLALSRGEGRGHLSVWQTREEKRERESTCMQVFMTCSGYVSAAATTLLLEAVKNVSTTFCTHTHTHTAL